MESERSHVTAPFFYALQHQDIQSTNALCDKINSNDFYKTTNEYLCFIKKYELGIHMRTH